MYPIRKGCCGPPNAISELRRVRDTVPWRLWLVTFVGFWERAAFWGLTAPWQNYMERPLHSDVWQTPGALGLGQTSATRIYCGFYAFYYATPIAAAIVADSYLGRYVTLVASAMLYCLGCVILTVTSMTNNLEKGWGLPGLTIAMLLIGLGGGGFHAVTIPFLADQQTKTTPMVITLRTGERVVTDYQLTLQYIYNLYYWVGNLGALSWFATVYLEMHVGFTAAYGLTLGFMGIAILLLVVGKPYYIKVPQEQNVVPEAVKIIVCACRNSFRMAHPHPAYQLDQHHKTVPWSGRLVDELTQGLQVCRVLLAFVMFYVCFDQMQNNLISQGQMNTDNTPNDLLPAMNTVGCIVLGPLIQEVLYPFLHRRRIYPSPIAYITIGFAFVTLSMLYATIFQFHIYKLRLCYDRSGGCGPAQINVWIQAPLYFLIAAGEIFAYVTALAYAYDQSPKALKVVVQATSLLIGGVGSACAMALTPAARDPHLVIFYGSLTGGMAITTLMFWYLFRAGVKQPKMKENTDGYRGVFDPVQSASFDSIDRVSDAVPILKPIDAGDPIKLPSRSASRLSRTLPHQTQIISSKPRLPPRSS